MAAYRLEGEVVGLEQRRGLLTELFDETGKVGGRQLFRADLQQQIRWLALNPEPRTLSLLSSFHVDPGVRGRVRRSAWQGCESAE